MKIVSWPVGVNTIVTSESNGTIGENGIESDTSSNGSEMSRLKGSGIPDKFSVTLYLSNSTTDAFYVNHTDSLGNHITELQAWEMWFKYITMNGVNPFYFKDIFDPTGKRTKIYKISSGGLPNWNPTGEYAQVHMTWIEQFNEVLTIPDLTAQADYLDIEPGMIYLSLTEVPAEVPDLSIFKDQHGESLVKYSLDEGSTLLTLPVYRLDYDGFKQIILYYDSLMTNAVSPSGYYIIYVPYNGQTISGEFAGGIE